MGGLIMGRPRCRNQPDYERKGPFCLPGCPQRDTLTLIAIALAFDAVNGEFNQRTMSRVLAQPIYRDALLLGKFLAGLFTLTLALTTSGCCSWAWASCKWGYRPAAKKWPAASGFC
jgi:hypothetical protein